MSFLTEMHEISKIFENLIRNDRENFMKIEKNTIATQHSLSKTDSVHQISQKNFKEVLGEMFNSIERDFKHSSHLTKDLIKTLPQEHKSLFQSQIYISEFQFKVEMMTRIADGLQQSIKKLQQQN